jgi:hypothetical protein
VNNSKGCGVVLRFAVIREDRQRSLSQPFGENRHIGECSRADSRHLPDFGQDLFVERNNASRGVIVWRMNGKERDIIRIETEIHCTNVPQVAEQQLRNDKKGERQGNLRDHERSGQTRASAAERSVLAGAAAPIQRTHGADGRPDTEG